MLYLCLALAGEVDVAPLHLLPDDSRVDQEQATSHLRIILVAGEFAEDDILKIYC